MQACRALITPNRIVYIAVLELNPNSSAHVRPRTADLVGETAVTTRHRAAAVFVAHDRRHYFPDASKMSTSHWRRSAGIGIFRIIFRSYMPFPSLAHREIGSV